VRRRGDRHGRGGRRGQRQRGGRAVGRRPQQRGEEAPDADAHRRQAQQGGERHASCQLPTSSLSSLHVMRTDALHVPCTQRVIVTPTSQPGPTYCSSVALGLALLLAMLLCMHSAAKGRLNSWCGSLRLTQGQRRPQQQIPTTESTSRTWTARGNADTAPTRIRTQKLTFVRCASKDGTVDAAQGVYGPANVTTRLEACPAVAQHAAVTLHRKCLVFCQCILHVSAGSCRPSRLQRTVWSIEPMPSSVCLASQTNLMMVWLPAEDCPASVNLLQQHHMCDLHIAKA